MNSLANLKLEFVNELCYYWGYDEIFLLCNDILIWQAMPILAFGISKMKIKFMHYIYTKNQLMSLLDDKDIITMNRMLYV